MSKKHHGKTVAVVDKNGKPLMPTTSARARILKKKGRAETFCYRPVYTIRLLDVEGGETQPVEIKEDTGYQYIGLSVASERHEFLDRQYDLLSDETERHDTSRTLRRSRRGRKRYRKPKFNNRKGMITKDGFAPSIRNKRNRHIDLIVSLCRIFPITDVFIEMGQFDIQVLKAMEEGKPLPKGEDYQRGEAYGSRTLRGAVFTRDGYTCQCCGRNAFKDRARLHEHHIGFWKPIPDRTNRLHNLLTVCEKWGLGK